MIKTVKQQAQEDPSDCIKLFNMRRLFRSQVYCLFATIAGLYMLLTEYTNWPMGLLHHWSPINVPLFELAAANWMLAIIEDVSCQEAVVAHLLILPGERTFELEGSFGGSLIGHHVLTISAYMWSLYTHYLGGLCVFGLCFEAPVLIMNIRDIIAAFEKELQFPFFTSLQLNCYYTTVHLLFHACRSIFTLLWPLSLIIWRKELATVPLVSRIIYHFFGALFCYVNATLYFYFLNRFKWEDRFRMGIVDRETYWKRVLVSQENIDSFIADEAIEADRIKLSAIKEVCPPGGIYMHKSSGGGGGGGCPATVSGNSSCPHNSESNHTKSATKLYDIATVQQHNSARNAWIIFNDNVYDVTKFLEQHPGGEQVLLEVAGGDATDAFLDVGHSVRARRMMESYKIGSLADDAETRAMASTSKAQVNVKGLPQKPAPQHHGKQPAALSSEAAAAAQIFSMFSFRRGAWKGKKQPLRELLSTEGPYHIFKPYFRDMHVLVCPAAATALMAVALSALSALDTASLQVTQAASQAAAAVVAKHGMDSVLGISINNDDIATLFAHVLCACGYTFLLYAVLAFSGIIRIDLEIAFQTVINGRLYVNSMLSAMWIAAEMSILVGFGLSGLGPRLYNTNMLLKMYQMSLLLTYIIETAIRRLTGTFVATSSGMTRSQKETLLNRGIAFFAVALLVDLTGWYRVFMSKGNVTEMWGGAWGAVLIIQVAVLRCVAMRFIPDRTYGEEQAHYMVWVGAMISGGFTFFIAIMHYTTSNFDFTSMFRLVWRTLCYALNGSYLVVYLSFAALLYTSHRLARWSNNAFTIQANTGILLIAMLMTVPSFTHARWVFVPVLTAGLVCISMESWKTLTGTANPPKHLFLAKQLEDHWRSYWAVLFGFFILHFIVRIVNIILPAKYMLWMYPGPVSDIQHCDYGIAFQVNGTPQQEPKVFVCNVGHFGDDMYDYARTGSSTSKMMEDLLDDEEAGKKGFVSDLVAVFPLEGKDEKGEYNENAYTFREVNFSSWASEEAAHDWYANNARHKSIVKEYHNGGLNEFSAMLATLEPKKPIRFEVRCRECRLMSDGPGDGVCPHCKKEGISPMPYM